MMINNKNDSGCLICGRELNYAGKPVTARCAYCGKEAETMIICPEGHYICDDCHKYDGLKAIETICLTSDSTDPLKLANQIMDIDFIHMHGPEHHALVPAVLVTAFKNKTGKLKNEHIAQAIKRGAQIQGGMCGNFGACGAGIGAGVASSVIFGTNPLSLEDWGTANQMTANALSAIAKKSGPRCCKRCTWTAIEAAIDFLEDTTGIKLHKTQTLGSCTHYWRNRQCQGVKCSYFPGGHENGKSPS